MATQSVTIAQSNSTDATWRAWVTGIHNALAALGTLTQTSDTGQINLATATKAAGGYEIWRFTDALQATAPCFIRLSYSSTSVCAIQFSYGTGTNGAGTLTGNVINHTIIGVTNTATAQTYKFSSTTSRLTIWLEADALHGAGGNGAIFTLERTRDNVGAEIGLGLMSVLAWAASANTSQSGWVAFGTGFPATNFNTVSLALNCIFADVATLSSDGQMTAFALNISGLNYSVMNPLLGILLYWGDDLTLAAPMRPITIYGAGHQYINTGGAPSFFNINTKAQAMMLYE